MYQEKASQECYKFKLFYSKESEGLVQELKFTLHWLKKHFYEWLRISAKVADNSGCFGENDNTNWRKWKHYLYSHIQGRIIYNSQDKETT